MWPPNLTELIATSPSSFKPCHFQLLPRKLQKLNIDFVSDDISLLDSHLEAGRNWLDIEMVEWTTLKKQVIETAKSLNKDASAYLSAVENGGLYGLPLSLTELALTLESRSIPIDLLIPPLMTYTSLMSLPEPFLTPKYFDLLPPSKDSHEVVLDFSNSQPSNARDSSIDVDTLSALFTTTISSLNLKWNGNDSVPKYLPRTLTCLELKVDTLDSKELSNLPPTLKILTLKCGLTHPNSELPWVDLLPRQLERFSAEFVIPIYGKHIALLPPHLESIIASFSHVTVAQVLITKKDPLCQCSNECTCRSRVH